MGSIGDLVFEDQDGDGQKDAGEPGIANITVTLSGPRGPYTASTGTDGSYLFAGLVAGNYTVDVDENDPDLPPGSVLTTGNDPLNVHLGESENFLNADFGFRAAQCTSPAITAQPQDQVIPSGGTATLTVTATGTAPLHYQCYQGSSGDTSNPVGADSASFATPALTQTTSLAMTFQAMGA